MPFRLVAILTCSLALAPFLQACAASYAACPATPPLAGQTFISPQDADLTITWERSEYRQRPAVGCERHDSFLITGLQIDEFDRDAMRRHFLLPEVVGTSLQTRGYDVLLTLMVSHRGSGEEYTLTVRGEDGSSVTAFVPN